MASLQEQLLKAGLGDKKKAKQINQEKRKKAKIKRKNKMETPDEVKASVAQTLAEKKERDRALNAEQKKQAEEKAIQAQIQQMISMNQMEQIKGNVEFKFTDDTKIKSLMVSTAIKDKLMQNKLAVARSLSGYAIIPIQVADKIAERDESWVLYRADRYDEVETGTQEEEDWYAEYEIPDDLTW